MISIHSNEKYRKTNKTNRYARQQPRIYKDRGYQCQLALHTADKPLQQRFQEWKQAEYKPLQEQVLTLSLLAHKPKRTKKEEQSYSQYIDWSASIENIKHQALEALIKEEKRTEEYTKILKLVSKAREQPITSVVDSTIHHDKEELTNTTTTTARPKINNILDDAGIS